MSNTQTTPAPAAAQQGTHHYLLTLQVPTGGGFYTSTYAGTCTPLAGSTRHDVYQQLRNEMARNNSQLAKATLLFFDLQPNRL